MPCRHPTAELHGECFSSTGTTQNISSKPVAETLLNPPLSKQYLDRFKFFFTLPRTPETRRCCGNATVSISCQLASKRWNHITVQRPFEVSGKNPIADVRGQVGPFLKPQNAEPLTELLVRVAFALVLAIAVARTSQFMLKTRSNLWKSRKQYIQDKVVAQRLMGPFAKTYLLKLPREDFGPWDDGVDDEEKEPELVLSNGARAMRRNPQLDL